MEISDRGYWVGVDRSEHQFDDYLANSILHMIIKHQYIDVLDIGCGDGSYTRVLNTNGVSCKGYDGNPNTPELSSHLCEVIDFSEPVSLYPVDLVICLEVGEHIPKDYESVFVDNLNNLTKKKLILSWAVPNQGGFGHVNCKHNADVLIILEKLSFSFNRYDTEFLRRRSTKSWFKNTLLVFNRL